MLTFSIRELLMIVAFLAFAAASLSIGGALAMAMSTIVGVCFGALSIVAIVARDQRQAFAIGFVLPFSLYVAIHYASEADELDPYNHSALVTTRAVQPIHRAIARQTWTEQLSGKVLPVFKLDPYTVPEPGADKIYVSHTGTAGSLTETPDRPTFMMVAHCLFASVLGYVGAKFAVVVRSSDQTLTSASDKRIDEP